MLAHTWVSAPPGPRSQLEEAIDGGDMEEYLDGSEDKRALLRWARDGAPQERWEEIAPILEDDCVPCHNGFTLPNLVPLDRYEPASRVAIPRSLLAQKIEWGSMDRYLEGPGEQETLLEWIERGAPESEWDEVEPILMDRCATCHNPLGVPGLPSLDRYSSTARIATLERDGESRSPIPLPVPLTALALATGGLMWVWKSKRKEA